MLKWLKRCKKNTEETTCQIGVDLLCGRFHYLEIREHVKSLVCNAFGNQAQLKNNLELVKLSKANLEPVLLVGPSSGKKHLIKQLRTSASILYCSPDLGTYISCNQITVLLDIEDIIGQLVLLEDEQTYHQCLQAASNLTHNNVFFIPASTDSQSMLPQVFKYLPPNSLKDMLCVSRAWGFYSIVEILSKMKITAVNELQKEVAGIIRSLQRLLLLSLNNGVKTVVVNLLYQYHSNETLQIYNQDIV